MAKMNISLILSIVGLIYCMKEFRRRVLRIRANHFLRSALSLLRYKTQRRRVAPTLHARHLKTIRNVLTFQAVVMKGALD